MTDVPVQPTVVERPRFLRFIFESLRFFARWFAIYPVLGALTAVMIGCIAFNFLDGFGIPDLFWRLTAPQMLLVGASIAIVFAIFCFVGFLLESETKLVKERGITPRGYFARTYTVLTFFFLLGAIRFDFEPGLVTHYARGWVSLLGYAIGVGLILLGAYVILPLIWRWIDTKWMDKAITAVVPTSASNEKLHGYALIVVANISIVYIVLAITMPRIPSATAVCILNAIFVMSYGFLRFVLPNLRFVVLVLAILLTGFVSVKSAYKHRYPEFGAAAYRNPAAIPPDGGNANPALIDNNAAFDAWAKQATKDGEKPRLALVATSGGGIRAAVWTASVLSRLSQGDIPHFSRHVRVITGASGGMVGGAFYVASLAEQDQPDIEFSKLAADSLEPVALSLALRDVPSLFIPGHFNDRGVALEQAWQRNATAMKTKLGDLAAGERAGWRPSLIFTPMMVEDARRALVSNLDLSFLTLNQGPQIGDGTHYLYSLPAVELLRILPDTSKVSVASLARMSASFPYVSTASEIPTNPRRHVVDAGYWDNYGVSVSVAWLAHNFKHIVEKTSGVVLIQVRDAEQQQTYIDVADPAEPGLPLAGYSEVVAPIVAMLRARSSIMILRNDTDVQQIAAAFHQATKNPQFFTTVILENPESAPLTWSLTDREAYDMLDYFKKNPNGEPSKRVNELREWWLHAQKGAVTASNVVVLP